MESRISNPAPRWHGTVREVLTMRTGQSVYRVHHLHGRIEWLTRDQFTLVIDGRKQGRRKHSNFPLLTG